MPRAMPSALVTEEGRSVRFRLQGKYFELSYDELRTLLGLPPPGRRGVGITIDQGRLQFEFPADKRTVELSAAQLYRRLSKQAASKS